MKLSKLVTLLVVAATAVFSEQKFEIVCYTPYHDGQTPDGPFPTEQQVREDIRILKQVTPAIKISAMGSLGRTIVEVCRQEGMNIHVGAWLGNVNDPLIAAANRQEIEDLVAVANLGYTHIKSLIVGSECLLRNEMSPAQLISFINEVKTRTSGYPVTSAEIYAKYTQYKGTSTDIAAAVNFILYNGHPYWEEKDHVTAAKTVIERWKIMRATFPGKSLILGEEGWPTTGEIYGNAFPSEPNQLAYYQTLLAEKAAYEASSGDKFSHMTFEGFDQAWNRTEGRVGGYWGLFYSDRSAKPAVRQLCALPLALDWVASYGDQTVNLQFSDPVERGSGTNGAENVANYAIDNGIAIYKATLKPDNRTVELVTSTMVYVWPYQVSVSNVRKATGGSAIATTTRSFTVENPSECFSLDNMVLNCDFSQGMKYWVNGFYSGGAGVMEVIDDELRVSITSGGTSGWCVQPQQTNLTLTNGQSYRLSFDMRSDVPRTVNVNCVQDQSPYTFYSNNPATQVTPQWKRYCYTFTMTRPTDTKTKIEFDLGNSGPGVVCIDNVVLEKTTATCPAISPASCESGTNMINNCGFSCGIKNWIPGWYEGSGGEMMAVNNELYVNMVTCGANPWSVQPAQTGLLVEYGKAYKVSFDAKVDWNRAIDVSVRENGGSFTAYSANETFDVTTAGDRYCFTFVMQYPTDNNAKLEFDLGGRGNGLVWIDNVVMEQTTASCNAPTPTLVWAVNCGGQAYTAGDGTVFGADASFTGGNAATTADPISLTTDDPLYQSERWGSWSYNKTLANGSYIVVLKFAENYFTTAGSRVFNIAIEGRQVVSNLDLVATVGHDAAHDVTISDVTLSDGSLTITGSASKDQPKISAIAVYSTDGTPVNQAPVANAGADRSVLKNATVTLDGSASYDPDNGPAALQYYWSQVSGPNTATIASPSSTTTSTQVTAIGTYEFELAVHDGALTTKDRVKVTVTNQAPVANAGADQTVSAGTAVTLNGNQSYDPDLGPQNPMSFSWTQISGATVSLSGASSMQATFTPALTGTYVFRLSVSDGAASATDDVSVTVTSTTTYINLPGRIEAEEYRPGGQNVGYYDNTAGNAGNTYRTDDVDIEATSDAGGGYNVGWTASGEWLEYNVSVATTGTYSLKARVASGATGTKTLTVSVGGVLKGTFSFTTANGWQSWSDVTVNNVNLSAGNHVVRVTLSTGNINLNYIDVIAAGGISLPGRIEAENYNTGGQNVGYYDKSSGNTGGAYRSDDVDIQACSDVGGGYNVGWTEAGEWLAYTVNVTTSGTYTFKARVASGASGTKTLTLAVDGTTRGTLNYTSSSGWQSWVDASLTGVSLTAGQHVVRISMTTGNINFNYIDVIRQ